MHRNYCWDIIFFPSYTGSTDHVLLLTSKYCNYREVNQSVGLRDRKIHFSLISGITHNLNQLLQAWGVLSMHNINLHNTDKKESCYILKPLHASSYLMALVISAISFTISKIFAVERSRYSPWSLDLVKGILNMPIESQYVTFLFDGSSNVLQFATIS